MTVIGIDPHKATHTAVAVDDDDEQAIDEFTLEASDGHVERLRGWADRFTKREWAVESASGLGYLIGRQLVSAGETVFDVPPVLASKVRLLGSGRSQKNDPNDARSVAIAALRSDRLATVQPDDHVTVALDETSNGLPPTSLRTVWARPAVAHIRLGGMILAGVARPGWAVGFHVEVLKAARLGPFRKGRRASRHEPTE